MARGRLPPGSGRKLPPPYPTSLNNLPPPPPGVVYWPNDIVDQLLQRPPSTEPEIQTIINKAVETLSIEFASERTKLIQEATAVFGDKLDLVVTKHKEALEHLRSQTKSQNELIETINEINKQIKESLTIITRSSDRALRYIGVDYFPVDSDDHTHSTIWHELQHLKRSCDAGFKNASSLDPQFIKRKIGDAVASVQTSIKQEVTAVSSKLDNDANAAIATNTRLRDLDTVVQSISTRLDNSNRYLSLLVTDEIEDVKYLTRAHADATAKILSGLGKNGCEGAFKEQQAAESITRVVDASQQKLVDAAIKSLFTMLEKPDVQNSIYQLIKSGCGGAFKEPQTTDCITRVVVSTFEKPEVQSMISRLIKSGCEGASTKPSSTSTTRSASPVHVDDRHQGNSTQTLHQSPLSPIPDEASPGPSLSRSILPKSRPTVTRPIPPPTVTRPILPPTVTRPILPPNNSATKRSSDNVSTNSPQPGTSKRQKNTNDQSSSMTGSWEIVNVGLKDTEASKRAPPVQLKQSGLPIEIQQLIRTFDRSDPADSKVKHRADSKSANKGKATTCWMTSNQPIDGFLLPSAAPTANSECEMCRHRRKQGDPSACFYFIDTRRISWFRLDS